MTAAGLDHLVVAAASLDEGVAWCEATLGMSPGPVGAHALFGTHNRLLRLHSGEHRRAYLEIIAIDPGASPTRPAPLRRWFDLDDPALRHRLQQQGPQVGVPVPKNGQLLVNQVAVVLSWTTDLSSHQQRARKPINRKNPGTRRSFLFSVFPYQRVWFVKYIHSFLPFFIPSLFTIDYCSS